MAAGRRRWRGWQGFIDPARLVFLDETSVTTNMARRYGWCPADERLVATAPHGHWHSTTFVAGLRLGGVTAPLVLDGPRPVPPSWPMSSRSWCRAWRRAMSWCLRRLLAASAPQLGSTPC